MFAPPKYCVKIAMNCKPNNCLANALAKVNIQEVRFR